MNSGKSLLLFLYGVSLYITLSAWYKNGNSGIPDGTVIAPATYLFAVLLLTANFLQGLPVILGTASTLVLWERSRPNPQTNANSVPVKKTLKIGSAKP